MDAVILAAGRGERLRPITDKIPKPLINLYGKPIIEWILQDLNKNNFRDVYIIVNHLKEKYKLNIIFIPQPYLGGEVHAVSLLPKDISDPFIVLMGDSLIENLNYKSIIESNYLGIVVKMTKEFA